MQKKTATSLPDSQEKAKRFYVYYRKKRLQNERENIKLLIHIIKEKYL